MKDQTGDQRNLIITIFTLIQFSGRMKRIFIMIISGTFKAIRPTFPAKEMITFTIGREFALKWKEINIHKHSPYDIMHISTSIVYKSIEAYVNINIHFKYCFTKSEDKSIFLF